MQVMRRTLAAKCLVPSSQKYPPRHEESVSWLFRGGLLCPTFVFAGLAPCDFLLLPKMKENLKGKRVKDVGTF